LEISCRGEKGERGRREKEKREKEERDFSTFCGVEPSDACNVFVEHFDHLILNYCTPYWFVYTYLQIQ